MARTRDRDGEEMVNTAVTLPRSQLDWLDDFKTRRVIGRSLIVERALAEYRERHDSEYRPSERAVRDLAGGS